MTSARYSSSIDSVNVGTTVEGSTAILFGDYESGMVYVPDGSTIGTLTWHASIKVDGPYLAAENTASAALTTVVAANQAHPIPDSLRGARFLKITGDVQGVVGVTLKD